jgi:hypothetical protein
MGQAEKIIEIARGETGYLEKKSNAKLDDKTANAGSGNFVKYWRDLRPSLQGSFWCACFISWCARKAGVAEDVFPTFFDCDVGMEWFRKRSRFIKRGGGIPKPGDVVFFGVPGDSKHVGLVRKTENGRVLTVEGNTSSAAGMVPNGGAVAEKSHELGYEKILGYGRPDYEEDEEVTQAEFDKMIEDFLARRDKLPVSGWAREMWDKAVKKGLVDDKKPQRFLTPQEAVALFDKAGLLK